MFSLVPLVVAKARVKRISGLIAPTEALALIAGVAGI
jgi:hypothetical protein